MRKFQKGVIQVILLIILVIVVIAASAGAYYLLKSVGKAPSQGLSPLRTQPPSASQSGEVSDSDEASVIESELDATIIDSPDADIKDLETSASSL